MASCSSGDAPRSKRKRYISEELPALPAPKRSPAAPQRDLLALPAPPTPIRSKSLYSQAPFKLNVLLPDDSHVILLEKDDDDLGVDELLLKVKRLASKRACSVRWGKHVYLEDKAGNIIEDGHIFDSAESSRILILQDGQPHSVHSLQDMWNVTPDPELLTSLPQEYTVETALADLLDNSLQAVWTNLPSERRSISVTLQRDKITIFDSGPGMDSTIENSIAKWGTMGSSKHRSLRVSAIGGKPPFLQPFFGMYGFGGLTAAMHLGGVAVVSSKTKTSRKVVSLTLEKEKLMESCKTDRSWKTAGQYREPTEEEMRWSPHGSFTKVELSKLKEESVWTEKHVMCMLKDIYFPYIQCDATDSTQGGTIMPVEFQVNGMNLTEVDGGEVALTNMSSCNGSPFEIDIKMKRTSQHSDPSLVNDLDRATARIKCFYFPIKGGKESIDNLLEELHNARIGINETFDNFCRVSIRRLGRLLPDARWRRLPFMEPKRKRRDKGSLPKICFERVKAFVDTDAGFIPTTSKMDLLSGHVFTSLLRNLGTCGNMPGDVTLEIYRGTRHIKLQEVEKEYGEWIHEMHGVFDEEAELDNEQYIISMEGADELGFSQDVYRIYTRMIRKGVTWKQGLRVKFFKGLPGCKAKDFYGTLEYFVSEGLSEDKGNTKVICRPMEIAKAEGSTVLIEDEGVRLELKKSKTVPIDFLTSDKCEILEEREWLRICDSKRLLEPGDIDILDKKIIENLGLNGGIDLVVKAGVRPFENIFAVIRPNSFLKSVQDGKSMNPVDQKTIVKKSMQMKMQLKQLIVLNPQTSGKANLEGFDVDNFMVASEQSINNIHGFYCFSMDKANFGKFYTKAGKYALEFSVIDEGSHDIILRKTLEVNVLPSDMVCRWILKDVDGSEIPTARLGEEIGPLLLHCHDNYNNLKDVNWRSDSSFEVWSGDSKLEINLSIEGIAQQENKKTTLIIKGIKLNGGSLSGIAEDYSATLKLIIGEKSEASMDIRVLPGEMSSVHVLRIDNLDNCLQTGDIIHTLTLQVTDKFGNHVERGCNVVLQLDNLELQDSQGHNRLVDDNGFIKLGGLLKVTGRFNGKASICIINEKQKLIYFKEFLLKRRALQVVSEIPEDCATGGSLHDVTVKIVDENGVIDKTMTGGQHLIMVDCAQQSAYPLKEGTCCIKSIQLSDQPGTWCCHINHVMYRELEAQIQLNLVAKFGHSLNFLDTNEDDEAPTLTFSDKSGSHKELENVMERILQRLQDCKKRMAHCVQRAEKAEEELQRMNEQKKIEKDKVSQLEEEIKSLHVQADNLQKSGLLNGSDKNDITAGRIVEEISRTNFPVKFFLEAFFSSVFVSTKAGNSHIADVVGIVCLLASAKEEALSRTLAGFIGEDSMLAVVCKTREAAGLLIRLNDSDGSIDESWGLYEYIKGQNQSVHGILRIFILEDMRFYRKGLEESHPQKLLKLDQPKLMDGSVPHGFLGYAVNLLQLNDEHLQLKIAGEEHGGLRGSLFYNLLKELQVYDTRRNLFRAKSALTTGGISLDGGVVRERGCEDFGQWKKAKILFPLHSVAGKKIPPLQSINEITQTVQIRDALRDKKQDLHERKMYLDEINCRIDFVKRKIQSRERKARITEAEIEKSNEEVVQLKKTMQCI